MKIRILSLLLLCSLSCLAGEPFSPEVAAGRYAEFAAMRTPEKLYLHLDRCCFAPGETIWMNGYLADSNPNSTLAPSNFIYVELLNSSGRCVRRVKLRRDGVSFPGHLDIPSDISQGNYTLRAYSLWQLNSPCEYMFNQSVTIISRRSRREQGQTQSGGLDVTFYPEGGRHFSESRSSIAFKAMDAQGRGVELRGRVVDSGGNELCNVETLHDGMGLLKFFPLEGEKYYLVSSDGSRWPLPSAEPEGASLEVSHVRDRYIFTVENVSGGPYSLLLRDALALRSLVAVGAEERSRSVVVYENSLNPGINHLLLVDMSGNIVSERLFYAGAGQSQPLSCSIENYGDSGRISLRAADGSPLGGQCSISVVREEMADRCQDGGIVSYMALSSELRGTIHDPDWYFDPSVPSGVRAAALDLLMMVQGWRYYDMPAIIRPDGVIDVKVWARERQQSVSGKVSRAVSSKTPSKFTFCVFIPSLQFTSFMDIEEGSRFVLDSLDLKENSAVLVKVIKKGGGFDFLPEWDGETFAPEFKYPFIPAPAVHSADLLFEFVTEKTDTLEAAVVSAEAVDDGFMEFFDGKNEDISSYEFFKDRTIIEYLSYRMPGFSYSNGEMTNTRAVGSLSYEYSAEKSENPENDPDLKNPRGVKLLVDGTVQDWDTYDRLQMGDVAALSITTTGNNFYDSPGGMVSIKIQPGTRVSEVRTEPSLLVMTPLGYQEPVRYYSPIHDNGDPAWSNTVWWNPSLRIEGGSARFEFYDPFAASDSGAGTSAASASGRGNAGYVIRVEGVSSDGVPFSGRL